jgi:hypothetical protein
MIRRWRRVLNKITGISTPFGGIQWDPATLDEDVAQRVLLFLEDRRVVFVPLAFEEKLHCVKSVIEIRYFITKLLDAGGISSELSARLDTMRFYCRRFLGRVGPVPGRSLLKAKGPLMFTGGQVRPVSGYYWGRRRLGLALYLLRARELPRNWGR